MVFVDVYSTQYVPCCFTGQKILSEVEQIDLVPTLSSLFNLPIPQNNLGVLLCSLVKAIDSDCSYQLLHAHRNAFQIVKLYSENIDLSQNGRYINVDE